MQRLNNFSLTDIIKTKKTSKNRSSFDMNKKKKERIIFRWHDDSSSIKEKDYQDTSMDMTVREYNFIVNVYALGK